MDFIKRKLTEGASALYRFWIWPWIRAYKEIKTHSIMKQGSYIPGTTLEGKNFVGRDAMLRNCTMGYCSVVQFDCDLTDTDIGRYSQVGGNISVIRGKHPTKKIVSVNPAFYNPEGVFGYAFTDKKIFADLAEKRTTIGADVWMGNDVRVLGGLTIGDGAIVGAGALVTKDLPPYSINVGVPAKTIGYRFEQDQIEKLLADKWWEKDEAWIRENIDRFADIEEFLK